jgi:purine-cytosine permease-like protein
MYEMISWVPCFIIFLIVAGVFGAHGNFENIPMGKGAGEAGSVLSFAASVFGFATGWTSYAADYTCYQPVRTNRVKVFFYVFAGLMFPLCFTEMLGVAVGKSSPFNSCYLRPTNDSLATATVNNPAFADAYNTHHVGGLLHETLVPHLGTFGNFCIIILALSIIGNNCPNIYSLSFSLLILTRYAQKVPRFLWTFIGTIVYCAIAIPGYAHFVSVLENFMLVIGYWLAIYEGISLPEHFIFRKGTRGYAPETYDQPKKLPVGIAAMGAFCCGIVGATMGMAQVWFIGPIGKLIGIGYGGDIGFELAFCFTFVAYLPLRYFEKKHFGR